MRFAFLLPVLALGCAPFGGGKDDAPARGSVCGHGLIIGEEIGRVTSGTSGCGISDAVRVTSIGGVALSQPSVMECKTARVFNDWVRGDLDRVLGIRGGGVDRIQIAAHYVCRTRNNRPGARISEHGKGKAIDISGFTFRDGTELSVARHWGRGRNGRQLKKLHKSACGPFGTVLGPEADASHKTHFHFDTAKHGNGPFCR